VNRAAFQRLVAAVLRQIPRAFRERIDNLSVQVEDWADAETLAEAGLGDPAELLGYYRGWPLTERGHDYGSCLPDVITLYQRAIEDEARLSGLSLEQVTRETLIHELGHYFGFDEAQMDEIERLWGGESPHPAT